MNRVVGLVLLVSISAALSGCTSEPKDDGAEGVDPTLITDPTQGRDSADMGPHLHNYWKGLDRLTVMDADISSQGILWYGPPIPVAEFRPESGDVVPQGAAWVNVTISWVDEADDNAYEDPQLWVKSAKDSEPKFFADLPGPEPTTIAIPSTNSMNDLPHQVLSAWEFQLVLTGGPNTLPPAVLGPTELKFSGTVSILVTTDRGLEIPLYPGHPDRWDGVTEIELLQATAELSYTGDPTTGSWSCFGGCPIIHVPEPGVVVPYDASEVVVSLDFMLGAPSKLGLKFHGADAREFTVPELIVDELNHREYRIPVTVGGDGPYALQSQWEFVPYIEFPQENSLVAYEEYTISATAYK